MRIQLFPRRFSDSLRVRAYAESRVWLSLRRAARHVSWVGLRLRRGAIGGQGPGFECQADAWLRGAGLVSVHHIGPTIRTTLDEAAVRLGRAVESQVRARPSGHRPGGEEDRPWRSAADRQYCEWTAERTWEDDGGAVRREPEPRKFPKRLVPLRGRGVPRRARAVSGTRA
jgi:hypothetical protein